MGRRARQRTTEDAERWHTHVTPVSALARRQRGDPANERASTAVERLQRRVSKMT